MWWAWLLVGLVGAWLVLLLVLWRVQPGTAALKESLRLLPDVIRLVSRLARDPSVPLVVRLRLWALLAYLLSPVDLVPDVIPVLGYADDAILVVWTLRSVFRRVPDAVTAQWPGTPEGLSVLRRLALSTPP